MLIYYILLAVVLGLAWPLCIRRPTREKKIVYLCVTFGFLFFLSAARVNIGNDYQVYIEIYQRVGNMPLGELFAQPEEKGYLLLCRLLGFFGMGVTQMYAVMALLCLAPVCFFINRYSPNVWLSVWLYITLTFFYGTMNFVRQNLAAAFLLLGYPLLRRRDWKGLAGYALLVLFCATFHKTALIMLPVMLVCLVPLNKWLGIFYGLAAVVLFFTSGFLVDFVTDFVYQNYKDDFYLHYGLEYYFLIVPGLLLVLILCFKKQVEQKYPGGYLVVNMMLYSAVIWLFITKHMILERFSLYVYFYALLGVPMACECLRPDEKLREKCAQLRAGAKQARTAQRDKAKYKKLNSDYQTLSERLLLGELYYWVLIAAVLIVTLWYNVFGMHDGASGFHGVFPYQSAIGWINRLP